MQSRCINQHIFSVDTTIFKVILTDFFSLIKPVVANMSGFVDQRLGPCTPAICEIIFETEWYIVHSRFYYSAYQ